MTLAADAKNYAKWIDHTLLKPEATQAQISQHCQQAKDFGFWSVCVHPIWVPLCRKFLAGTSVQVCTVVGFPFGSESAFSKASCARWALENGAHEIDMVQTIGFAKSGMWTELAHDIKSVVEVSRGHIVKVILETHLLNEEEKAKCCQIAIESGAGYVKTSTGFSGGGATVEDVTLLKNICRDRAKVKASGGIRDLATIERLLQSGADRIGTSSGPLLMRGQSTEMVY